MRKTAVILVALTLASSGLARDLNRQNYHIGERAAGMGGAFVSLVGDPASTYFNPAGLGGMHKRGISLSASVYQLNIESYEKVVDLTEGLTTDMSSNTFATFPSSMVYLLPLDKNTEPGAFHHVLAFSVLVPDYDKMKAEIDMPIGEWAFEMKGTFLNEDLTYWAGPTYAMALGGSLRLGVSLFVLAHMSDTQAKIGTKAGWEDPVLGDLNFYSTGMFERSAMGVTMLVQAGVQYDITDNLSVGLTLRSPTLGTFYSKVSQLDFNSYYAEDADGNPIVTVDEPGYVDRIESEDIEMNYRLPMMAAVGASYQVPDSFTIALDLSFHLPQDSYQLFRGRLVYPKDPGGNDIMDPERALDPDESRKNSMVFNANLGAEFNVTKDILIRAGLFTDLSAVDQEFYDADELRGDSLVLPMLSRFGISLGLGMIGEKSTTSFGVTYVVGMGDTYGLNDAFGAPPAKVDVTSHTITAVLAGSADL